MAFHDLCFVFAPSRQRIFSLYLLEIWNANDFGMLGFYTRFVLTALLFITTIKAPECARNAHFAVRVESLGIVVDACQLAWPLLLFPVCRSQHDERDAKRRLPQSDGAEHCGDSH